MLKEVQGACTFRVYLSVLVGVILEVCSSFPFFSAAKSSGWIGGSISVKTSTSVRVRQAGKKHRVLVLTTPTTTWGYTRYSIYLLYYWQTSIHSIW